MNDLREMLLLWVISLTVTAGTIAVAECACRLLTGQWFEVVLRLSGKP